MKKFILIPLAIALLGCGKSNNSLVVPIKTLEVNRKIISLGDSTYFGLISEIEYNNSSLYLSDFTNSQVLKLDKNYNLQKIIGRPGDGPGEIRGALGLNIDQSNIFVLDDEHQKLKIYNHDGSFSYQTERLMPQNGNFIIHNSTLIGSRYDESNLPIFSYNLKDTLPIKYFGTHVRQLNGINVQKPRNFNLEQWKNKIIAVCETDPVVETYDFEGRLLGSLDLKNLEYFKDYIKKIKVDQEKNQSGVYSFLYHPVISNNKLYISIVGYNRKRKREESNHILVCDLTDNQIVPLELFELNNEGVDAWYDSFSIINNKIIAFDGLSYELHEYKF